VAFNSYRYPRYHLAPPAAADHPWTPVASVDQTDDGGHTNEVEGEIDLTTIDLRVAEGTVTWF
jgi:hypothetical protein